jgi:hypothetical protein
MGSPTDRLVIDLLVTLIRGELKIMANFDSINAALTDLSAQISQLATQVGELQAGTVTQEQLDAVAAGIAAAAASVDAIIEPDAGETPPGS